MDPRHPELAVNRLKELIKQYDRIENDIKNATVSSRLGQLEREGGLVVQEMCLVAPRVHEALIQVSRQRRHQLSMGIAYVPEEKVGKYIKATIGTTGEEEGVVVGPTDQIIAINEMTTEEAKVVENPYEQMREYAATAVREEDVNEKPKKRGRKKKAE